MIYTDLPLPKLAPLKETVKEEKLKPVDTATPTIFAYTYQELQKLDTITVQIVPEKKGMVFKYQEYFIESKVKCNHCTVRLIVYVCVYV